jgi:hypothetical protein
MLNDKEFFAALLEAHAATTAGSYWEPVQQGDTWNIWAVDGEDRTLVAVALEKPDADFMCAVHGCLPQVVRRLEAAIEEAERADESRDEREQLIAELIRKQEGT